VFYTQERMGLDGKAFNVYKFRSMHLGAEDSTGPVWARDDDPRATPIGRWLRRLDIDELPQLWNVLRGDMSLVGPRPLPVRDYEGFNEDWQRRRFSVRPGITCIWQVGGRSSVSFEKWMELDLQYIDKWSLWLDFQILLRTIPAVLKGSGAA
jgi:lipopolysaccharide/colanic/teichoic acid biosynthesis glycosyltransferase